MRFRGGASVRFPSEVRFASALVYSKGGLSSAARTSREVRDRIKRGEPRILAAASSRIPTWFAAEVLNEFFGSDVILVPMPGSGVLPEKLPRRIHGFASPLWVARDLCVALHACGLGAEVWDGLRRVRAVAKSAFAAPGQRPTVRQHYHSMTCSPRLFGARVTIVDDFITKGRTAMAAATHVLEAVSGSEVRVFALVRTMNLMSDITQLVDPVVGVIRCVDEDAVRVP